MLRTTTALAGIVLISGCAGGAPETPRSAENVAITVAPLDLPGVTNASWRLTVTNGAATPETVWTRTIDADGYGDGAGSVAYVGPCDADANDNTVTVELLELYGGAAGTAVVDPGSYDNPGPLSRDFTCVPNADVAVDFDVVVLRAANQGFFDIAVSFDNIFCSAKLDCTSALLHNSGGARDTTFILALACTGDPSGATQTHLYLDDIDIDCAVESATVDPSYGPGNLSEGQGYTQTSPLLFGAAVYRGAEQIAGKLYWNVAMGWAGHASGVSCDLEAHGTAARGPLAGYTTPSGTTYPVIDWVVPLTNSSGTIICTQHEVNGDPAGVATTYSPLSAPVTFDHQYNDLPEPLFTEYVEGSSYNKAVEVGNLGTGPLDASDCEINVYNNGGATPSSTIALSGSVSVGGTLVVCHTSADQALIDVCDIENGNFNHNGDDALELVCGGETVDVIGRVGEDPGSQWGSGGLSTQDATLRRKCAVTSGDPDGTNDFAADLTAEWDAEAVDTFDGLGAISCP